MEVETPTRRCVTCAVGLPVRVFAALAGMLRTRIAAAAAVVTVGNIAKAGCVFLAWAVAARAMGPKDFGAFAFAYGAMSIVASLSELGLSVGVVKFIAGRDPASRDTQDVLAASFWLRAAFTLTASLVVFLGADWIAIHLMHNALLGRLLRLAAIGGVGSSYCGFVLSVAQGFQRFKLYGAVSTLAGLILVGGIACLEWTHALDIDSALLLAALSFFGAGALGHALLKVPILRWPGHWKETRELLSFSKWVQLGSILALATMQADVFLLTRLCPLEEVGIYSAGQRLAFSVSILSLSLQTVVLPRILADRNQQAGRRFYSLIVRYLPVLPLVVLVAGFLAAPVVRITFGIRYQHASGIFTVLFGAFLLSTFANALGQVGYGLNRPQLIVTNLALQFALLVAGGLILTPMWGAMGMAGSVLISRVAGLAYMLTTISWALRNSHAV